MVKELLKIIPILSKAVLSTSILVNWEGFLFLLDIGPGSTVEMINRRIKTSKIKSIFITHSHIDHFWDLVPFLWLRRLRNQTNPLKVFCPKPYKDLFDWCIGVAKAKDFAFVQAIDEDSTIKINNLMIKPFRVEHADEEIAFGYVITEEPRTKLLIEKLKDKGVPVKLWHKIVKGEKLFFNGKMIDPEEFSYKKQRKIVYSGDTRACEVLKKVSENADLLIVEASYIEEKLQDIAFKKGHMTLKDALKIALESKVKSILLTHFSLNYSLEKIVQEAQKIIKDVKNPPKLFIDSKEVIIN